MTPVKTNVFVVIYCNTKFEPTHQLKTYIVAKDVAQVIEFLTKCHPHYQIHSVASHLNEVYKYD